jgi:hypothetical protein
MHPGRPRIRGSSPETGWWSCGGRASHCREQRRTSVSEHGYKVGEGRTGSCVCVCVCVCVTGLRGRRTRTGHACGDAQCAVRGCRIASCDHEDEARRKVRNRSLLASVCSCCFVCSAAAQELRSPKRERESSDGSRLCHGICRELAVRLHSRSRDACHVRFAHPRRLHGQHAHLHVGARCHVSDQQVRR